MIIYAFLLSFQLKGSDLVRDLNLFVRAHGDFSMTHNEHVRLRNFKLTGEKK